MAGKLGCVEEFDNNNDDWPQYAERLGNFFVANGIDATEKKRAVLLSVVGASTYKTLRNLVSPMKPGEKTYDELLPRSPNITSPRHPRSLSGSSLIVAAANQGSQ